MRRSNVLSTLAGHKKEMFAFGVKLLAIFGPVARDEARQDSDVDILVEFQGPATFNGYMDLKFFLEDLLGRPIDLVTSRSIRLKNQSTVEERGPICRGTTCLILRILKLRLTKFSAHAFPGFEEPVPVWLGDDSLFVEKDEPNNITEGRFFFAQPLYLYAQEHYHPGEVLALRDQKYIWRLIRLNLRRLRYGEACIYI